MVLVIFYQVIHHRVGGETRSGRCLQKPPPVDVRRTSSPCDTEQHTGAHGNPVKHRRREANSRAHEIGMPSRGGYEYCCRIRP